MLPSTNNFSELTDIDTSSALEVSVKLRVNGDIKYRFTVNDDVVDATEWNKSYELRAPLRFKCQVTEFIPGHSGVDIQSITVNGIEVLPLYCGRATPPTSYISFAESWSFDIMVPFYVWHHDITGQGWVA